MNVGERLRRSWGTESEEYPWRRARAVARRGEEKEEELVVVVATLGREGMVEVEVDVWLRFDVEGLVIMSNMSSAMVLFGLGCFGSDGDEGVGNSGVCGAEVSWGYFAVGRGWISRIRPGRKSWDG